MAADKKPLNELVKIERMKGREPLMTTLMAILDRLLDGERDNGAVDLLAEHGVPAMLLRADQAGLLQGSHLETWKSRLTPVEAEMILTTKESTPWPAEVREWAAVVAVGAL